MTTESAKEELSSLLKQTQEHIFYFQELGVTGANHPSLEPASAVHESELPLSQQLAAPVATPALQNAVVEPRPSIPPDSQLSEPIQRSAQVNPTSARDSLFYDPAIPAEVIAQSTESLEQIWADLKDCTRCPLHEGRTNIVHTEGNSRARLMFVGEAPGADEDAQARPFVGRAGQLLTKIIEAIGFKREDVLIGNVNRCRPPANRAPLPDEAATCKPFLLREIASVKPEVIVVMGNTAMKNLLDTKVGITRLRGEFQDFRGIKVMPTFHPAYLLRDPSKKRETWEDLKKVRDYLDSTAKRER